jgi:hypothetical protein
LQPPREQQQQQQLARWTFSQTTDTDLFSLFLFPSCAVFFLFLPQSVYVLRCEEEQKTGEFEKMKSIAAQRRPVPTTKRRSNENK